MRLLAIKQDGSLALEGPFSKNVPPYAILSHTWGADNEEVTFQDLQSGLGTTKTGYEKLKFCQKQAKADNIEFIWIDTCCVNKESSAELSEAINSMFKWYHYSTRCYAFLQDIPTAQPMAQTLQLFRSSRWFTRGWTLQELIAPPDVEFFDQAGASLGTKASFVDLIEDITGVPKAALLSFTPFKFDRHDIRSWSNGRETTREEDMAYCMLGLHGVYLPPIYGEGIHNAIWRLDDVLNRRLAPQHVNQEKEPQQADSGAHLSAREANGSKKDTAQGLATLSYSVEERLCLRMLWFPTIALRRQEIENPGTGTCSWLFKHDSFITWRSSSPKHPADRLLWLTGHPGVGKSVLMKVAARHLQAEAEAVGNNGVIATFFFTNKGHELQRTLLGLFRSILYQLSLQDRSILQALVRACADRIQVCSLGNEASQDWSMGEVMNIMMSVLSDSQADCITLLVDGFDECEGGFTQKQKTFWLQLLCANSQLRILISARNWSPFHASSPRIFVNLCNDEDIKKYVTERLMICLSDEDRLGWEILRDKIISKASNIFLWAVLVLDDLLDQFEQGQSIRYLLTQVEVVPEQLELLFTHILGSIPEHELWLSLYLFRWAVLAIQPLRVHEWHHIMALIQRPMPKSLKTWQSSGAYIESDEQLQKRIFSLSRGLVEIKNVRDESWHEEGDRVSVRAGAGSLDQGKGGSRFVQTIHESVQRFFLQNLFFTTGVDEDLLTPEEHVAPGHFAIMRECLHYIQMAEFDDFVDAQHVALEEQEREILTSYSKQITQTRDSEAPHPTAMDLYFHNLGQIPHFLKDDGATRATEGLKNKSIEKTHHVSPPDSTKSTSEPAIPNLGNVDRTIRKHTGMTRIAKLERPQAALSSSTLPLATAFPRAHVMDIRSATELNDHVQSTLSAQDRYDYIKAWLSDVSEVENPPTQVPDIGPTLRETSTTMSITGRSCVLQEHLALLSYIITFFWEHARRAEDCGFINEDLVEQFAEPSMWRRWQAIDTRAPFFSQENPVVLQCEYLTARGLQSWVDYIENRPHISMGQDKGPRSGEDADRHPNAPKFEKHLLERIREAARQSAPADEPRPKSPMESWSMNLDNFRVPRPSSIISFGSAGSHGSSGGHHSPKSLGDFASLRDGLSTEDYIAWRLPEEEDADLYHF